MIAIGSDHGGFELKKKLMEHLSERGLEYKDFGTYSSASCDYPVYAKAVARAVASGECDRGILICGTGIGVSMTANKVHGIRAPCAGTASPPRRRGSITTRTFSAWARESSARVWRSR